MMMGVPLRTRRFVRGVGAGSALTLSILLLGAVGSGWIGSYRAQHIASALFGDDCYTVRSAEGVLVVHLSRDWSPNFPGPHPRVWASTHGRGPAIPDRAFWNRRGLFAHGTENGLVIAFPYWVAVGITAIVPSLIIRRAARRSLRSRRGLCPRCGYDLRATSGRCPECGGAADQRRGRTARAGGRNRDRRSGAD